VRKCLAQNSRKIVSIKRNRGALRCLCAALGVVLGGMLLVSAYCSSRFAVRDLEFVLNSPWMDPWARTWLWRGDGARFQELDTARAVEAYWQGIARNPLLFDGWFALARLERQRETGSADALHDFLIAHVPVSTTWRWQQLLLAAERRDEPRFAQAFNYVLHRLAEYRQEAVEVALGFWGEWPAILTHTDCNNRWTLIKECMARRAVDACIGLYPLLEDGCGASPDRKQQAEFIEFLFRNKRWAEAALVGRRGGLFRDGPVTNGRFDSPLSGTAFDWRLTRIQGVEARREANSDMADKTGAGHVMRFHFLGTANLRYEHLRQYVPLRPGTTCELRFSWMARRLTTDQGLYVEVRGEGCEGLSARSPAITGSRDWNEERLVFDVPDGCLMARIVLRRDQSLRFDGKIAGDVWLDDVELVERQDLHIKSDADPL